MAIAAKMRAVGRAGDLQHFLELDIQYHALVLAASGNEMFAQMHSMIAEVLRGRTDYGLMPAHPHEEALQLHVDVADAIQSGRPEAARQAMDQIMRRTIEEVRSVWEDEPRQFEEADA
jgi:DNA-binding FadR family transcriptional regulator